MTNEEARARVAKGAAHLDQVRPGWFNRIDVGTLTLHDPCGCIVGQLCGTGEWFSRGLTLLDVGDAEELGFERTTPPIDSWNSIDQLHAINKRSYALLQEAWIEAIADRLLPTSDEGKTVPAGATPLAVGVTGSAQESSS